MADTYPLTWEEFVRENPTFTSAYHKAWKLLPALFLAVNPQEDDQAGMLILQLMMASISDFDHIM